MKILLQKALGVALALALAVAAFVFVSVVLAVGVALALVLGGWLWWRGGRLAGAPAPRPEGGAVIEGEYRVEGELRRVSRD